MTDPDTTPMLPMLLMPGRNQPILPTHRDRALQAEVLVACDADTRFDPDPPCGTQHGGDTYYHLAPGKTLDDYAAAAIPEPEPPAPPEDVIPGGPR